MSSLQALVGCWKVRRFVDPDNMNEPAFVGRKPPKSLRDLIRRNEVLYLKRTQKEHILFGQYKKSNVTFWIHQRWAQRTREPDVVIKARGELVNAGSYQLVKWGQKCLGWKSLRKGERRHAIEWAKIDNLNPNDQVRMDGIVVPEVPSSLTQKRSANCACGDADCLSRTDGCALYVKIAKPKKEAYTIEKLNSKNKRDRERALWAQSRALAHWESFHSVETNNRTSGNKRAKKSVSICHMHPFAVQTWKERSQQSHFKTFVLSRASVDAAVKSEDKAAYFLLVDDLKGYLPKLNFPVQERGAISSAAPCHTIATTEIENLREQIAQLQKTTTSLRERNSELQSQLDKERHREKPPERRRSERLSKTKLKRKDGKGGRDQKKMRRK